MTPFKPSHLIIGMYQEMMEWMSSILIGFVANGHDDFVLGVGQMEPIFAPILTTNPTQHDPHGPDDTFQTINSHHWDLSREDGMDEQHIDWICGQWS